MPPTSRKPRHRKPTAAKNNIQRRLLVLGSVSRTGVGSANGLEHQPCRTTLAPIFINFSRSVVRSLAQCQCLFRVRNGPSATSSGRSAAGGEADEIGAKADIGAGMSAVRGKADVPATWPGSPLLARRRHSPASKFRPLKGRNRPKTAIPVC